MSNDWPRVPLAQLLKKSEHWVDIKAQCRYKQVTVRLWGGGVAERNEVSGAEIAAARRLVVRSGQFLLSRIDARNGAFGIVPEHLDGAVVSSDFPVFELQPARIVPSYLGWLSKTGDFVALCKAASEGTTNRVRLKESRFLSMAIPLPPLPDQRRIVARIEEPAAKIEEARGLRRQAVEEAEMLWDSATVAIFQAPELKPFLVSIADADLVLNRESRDPARTNPDGEFAYVDVSSVGRGPLVLNRAQLLPASQAPSRARRVVRGGDVIFSTVRPNLRAVGKIGAELDNQICSTGFAVFSCGQTIDPDFLLYQLCSPFFIDQCIERTTGAHYPAINDMNLRQVDLVVPPLSAQHRIVAHLDDLQTKVNSVKRLQAETAVELDAMLPSILDKAFKGEL
jgi:type I restriction enzyme S subunit